MSAFIKTLHPKVIAATVGTLLASIALGLVLQFAATPSATEGLPSWAVFLITALTPTVVSFLSGYAKKGPDTPNLEAAA